MSRPYRVVQWTTGNVGRRSVLAVIANPGLELVGCYAWSADKVGRDAGELAGADPIGVVATNDKAALLALKPDCVIYNPKWPDVEEMAEILESGTNVVATAGFITGHALGAGRERLIEACGRGSSSIFGSGMNPGPGEPAGHRFGRICDRIDSIAVLESVDSTGYDSADTELSVGYARPIDDPELPALVERGSAVFGDAVHLMADALGVEIDEVRCESSFAQTTRISTSDRGRLPRGASRGSRRAGRAGRTARRSSSSTCGGAKARLEPDLEVQHGYVVDIKGQPCVHTKLEIFPGPDFKAKSFIDYMVLGMIMTAMPAMNAIPGVAVPIRGS